LEYYHDFAVTKNHVIFGTTGVHIDFIKMPQLMMGRQPLAYGAKFYEEDGYFYILDRNKGIRQKPQEYKTDPFFATHVINAYEDETTVRYFISETTERQFKIQNKLVIFEQ